MTPNGPLTACPFKKFTNVSGSPLRSAVLARSRPGRPRGALVNCGSRSATRTTADTKRRSNANRASRRRSSRLFMRATVRSATAAATVAIVRSLPLHMRTVKPGKRISAKRSAGRSVPNGSRLPGGSSARSRGVATGSQSALSGMGNRFLNVQASSNLSPQYVHSESLSEERQGSTAPLPSPGRVPNSCPVTVSDLDHGSIGQTSRACLPYPPPGCPAR